MALTKSTISLAQTNQFSDLFLNFVEKNKDIDNFISYPSTNKGFEEILRNKKFNNAHRIALSATLEKQYKNAEISPSENVKGNIELLKNENTFTVTTGHQLCLMTGPIYFIFKIITTINLAKKLKADFPDKNFVPVYWMATEDHDFEEISHFSLFGKTHTWETNQKGAVGDFDITGLADFLTTVSSENPFIAHYKNKTNLAQATACLVNHLFDKEGLVIIDGNDKSLKSVFIEHIKNDIFKHLAFEHISNQSKIIKDLGYEPQVHAREINFFYLMPTIRERIIKEDDVYKVLNTAIQFSEKELNDEIENFPERFSPNVCLRPLYQELILPNLAYIGGPGEIAYWLQLKSFFDASDVILPILIPRNFGVIIQKSVEEKLKKLKIELADLFLDVPALKKLYLANSGETSVDLESYKEKIAKIFEELKKQITTIDGSLAGFVEAQKNESSKQFENIAKKLTKALELKENTQIEQLLKIQSKLFPDGELQERSVNFLNFELNNPNFIQNLIDVFNPLNFKFQILVEE